MATEIPITKESIEEKLGELKVDDPEVKEAVLEALTESPPEVKPVESPEPAAEPTEEGGVVKAEVPEAVEELKTDNEIVPPAESKPPVEPASVSV